MRKPIQMFSPDGGVGSAFKTAGNLGDTTADKPVRRCDVCGGEMAAKDTFCRNCGHKPGGGRTDHEKVRMGAPQTDAGKHADGFFTSGGSLIGEGVGSGSGHAKVSATKDHGPEVRISTVHGKTAGGRRKNAAASDSGMGKKDAGARRRAKKNVVLMADIKTKKVKNNSGVGMKELIRDIHMEIQEGTLVALLGTAGAGKSTVMNCLNGMDLQGVEGRVLYRGVDLMKNFEEMKYLIGSGPQKKIFHAAFTPEEEFTQAAMLRLPADTSEAEIKRRVDQTLEMLSMTGVRKNRNSKLSGGEQTRVNVGIELVADRDLLCLDEPDQGLSPNYKHELFEIMRNLAHTYGKTVLSIIHDVSELDMFDQVVMLAKVDGVGRLAFSGTPEEAREYFGVDIRDAYALLERDPKRFVK